MQSALPAVSSTVFLLNQCPLPQRCQWKRPRVSGTPSQAHQGLPGGSVVKNPSANAGDTRDVGPIPGLGRSPGVGNGNLLQYSWGFPSGSEVKVSACNAGDLGSIPGSRRSPGEGNGNPLQYLAWRNPWVEEPGGSTVSTERLYFHFQYSCLDYPMDRGAWWTWGCKESDMTE